MSALGLHGVSRTHGTGRRAVRALHDVTLEVAEGEIVLVDGPSGSGKTTLLAVSAGLLSPDHGEVRVAGKILRDLARGELRRHRARTVGFVFQRSNLLDGLTGRENVLLQAALAGVPRGEALSRSQELLESLGLAGLGDRLPRELSAGEEQRFAVARALVHRPAVILADEPTASLDGPSGLAVAGLLATLARACAAAVVVATHDPRLVLVGARRVRLVDGRIAADAPPRRAGASPGRESAWTGSSAR